MVRHALSSIGRVLGTEPLDNRGKLRKVRPREQGKANSVDVLLESCLDHLGY